MSLRKRAKAATVDGSIVRAAPLPQGAPPPGTASEPVEPLGAHDAPGNDAARKAFVREAGVDPAAQGPGAVDADTGGAGPSAETGEPAAEFTGLTWEQAAAIGAELVSVLGSVAGPMVVKGTTARQWAQTPEEKELTARAGEPVLRHYETSLGPAGDPVVLTAVAQSTISGPNLVRAMLADYSYGSGEKMPPLGELPVSGTNINLTAGFVGAPIVTQIFRRDRAQAENMMRLACDRAGIPYTGVQPIVDVPGLRGFSPYKPG